MRVFMNMETKEIISVFNFLDKPDESTEGWEYVLDELKKNAHKYFEFTKMSSGRSFKVMEEFVENLDNEELQEKLYEALSGEKVFRKFKDIIEAEYVYKNKWFSFKNSHNSVWIREQLSNYFKKKELEND